MPFFRDGEALAQLVKALALEEPDGLQRGLLGLHGSGGAASGGHCAVVSQKFPQCHASACAPTYSSAAWVCTCLSLLCSHGAGKPSAGKSTFLNAATDANAKVGSYPFTTIEPNHGVGFYVIPCPCAR